MAPMAKAQHQLRACSWANRARTFRLRIISQKQQARLTTAPKLENMNQTALLANAAGAPRFCAARSVLVPNVSPMLGKQDRNPEATAMRRPGTNRECETLRAR